MAEEIKRSGSLYGGTAEPCAVVLFGASGDLAKRKVIPAMFDLANHNSLGSRYVIVGFARTPMSDENFRATTGEAAKTMSEIGPVDPKQWDEFASCSVLQLWRLLGSAGVRATGQAADAARSRQKTRRQPALLPFDAAGSLSAHRRATWTCRTGAARLRRTPGCASSSKSRLGAIWPPRRN